MSATEATAVEAARDFINSLSASFTMFVQRQYSLTPQEALLAAERFRRELDARIERERAERILAICPEEEGQQ